VAYAQVPSIGASGPVWPPSKLNVPPVGPSGPIHLPSGQGRLPQYTTESTPPPTYKKSPTILAWEREKHKALQKLRMEIIKVTIKDVSRVKPQYLPPDHPVERAYYKFFGIGGSIQFQGKVPDGKTPLTRIASENLRRAASVLFAAERANSHEDAMFLANEAGLAMFGAPLRVTVPPSTESSKQKRVLDELLRVANGLERDIIHMQNIARERQRIETELFNSEEQVKEIRKKYGENTTELQNVQKEFHKLEKEYHEVIRKQAVTKEAVMKKQNVFRKKVNSYVIDMGGEESDNVETRQ